MDKYPEIENHYREKYIQKFPERFDRRYVVQEKLDGANFRVEITSEGISYGSRKTNLNEGDSLYGYKEVLPSIQPVIAACTTYAVFQDCSITLFGELFGPGIQKRIHYPEKRILFFDMSINRELCSQALFQAFFNMLHIKEFMVPILADDITFEAAMAFEVEGRNSTLVAEQLEGVVIKPTFPIMDDYSNPFYIKKKAEKFKEIEVVKEEKPVYYSPILPYINTNRVLSVFSKVGALTEKSQMKQYINWVVDDAFNDYSKDHPEYDPIPEDRKTCANAAAHLLLKEI